jgi:hypothetical protein
VNLIPEEIKIKFSTQRRSKRTAWQFAAEWGKTESLEEIWEWTYTEQCREEINNELLIAKNYRKQTVWRYTSMWDNVQLLRKIWKWSKEHLTQE